MPAYVIKQGEDMKFVVPLLDQNVPVQIKPATPSDPDLVLNIKAILKVGTAEVARYALVAEDGFGIIELHDTMTHAVEILATRSQTRNWVPGVLKAFIAADFIDPEFVNGRRVEFEVSLGRVAQGNTVELNP